MPSTADKWLELFTQWTEINNSVKDVLSVMPPFEESKEKMGMVFQSLEGQTQLLLSRYQDLKDGIGDAPPAFYEKDLNIRYQPIKVAADALVGDTRSANLMIGSYREEVAEADFADPGAVDNIKIQYDMAKTQIDALLSRGEPLRDLGRGVKIKLKKMRKG